MTSPARFTKGVTNIASGKNLGQLLIPDPMSVHQWVDDFHKFVPGEWFITRVQTGATAGSETISDADGGVLAITCPSGDDDSTFFQYKGYDNVTTASEIFTFTAAKKLWFKARFKVSDATQSDFIIGLQTADTTPLTAPVAGVWFQKDDGDASLDFNVYDTSAAVLADAAVTTVSDDTYLTCGFYYDGSKLYYYVNDAEVGSSAGIAVPADELTISFGIQNGAAAAKILTVDYIEVIKER